MSKTVALVCMAEHGHVRRALALARELALGGATVHAFTGRHFAAEFRGAGAIFHDLFAQRPLDAADASSIPIPCRYVSFAATYADSFVDELRAISPDIILHDAFAVIALPAAQMLDRPRVAICAGHNMSPAHAVAELRTDARVNIAPACHSAVEILQKKYAISGASPFSYLDSLSPLLNVISEPPEFLTDHEQADFAPAVFFGSIDRPFYERFQRHRKEDTKEGLVNVYASLGTVARRYYSHAIDLLVASLIEAAGRMNGFTFSVSLGSSRPAHIATFSGNISFSPFVDQGEALSKADIFLTHHGLNSTHEAIYLGVPMLSYPIFHDQPGLARRCQEFGLALSLSPELRGPVSPSMVKEALEKILRQADIMRARLETARAWEERVIERRGEVVDRILSLA